MKNAAIAADASGPRGSVCEPAFLPPDQAWPAPCTSHCSTIGTPFASAWTVRTNDLPPGDRALSCRDDNMPAGKAASADSMTWRPLAGCTVRSCRPWKTIVRTGLRIGADGGPARDPREGAAADACVASATFEAAPRFIAASAEGRSWAAPARSPLCTATAANNSG